MARIDVPAEFRRSADSVVERTDESALFLMRHACDAIGLADLSDTELLDVGCGTKFTEAFLNHEVGQTVRGCRHLRRDDRVPAA